MTTEVTATVVNGMLRPDRALPLPEQSRVRLTIEPLEEGSSERAWAAWQAILVRLKERPIHGGGLHYTRDEHHERC